VSFAPIVEKLVNTGEERALSAAETAAAVPAGSMSLGAVVSLHAAARTASVAPRAIRRHS
jgi:hypothetical protein